MKSNWNNTPFQSIFSWQEKSQIKSGDGEKTGQYKMFVCSDTEVKRLNNHLLDKEALIFGTGGKASIHYCNEPFSYSTDCVVACCNSKVVSHKFVYYFFRRKNLSILQEGFKGSGLQHISKKYIEVIEIPLPPMQEQERIVEKIEELFSELDKGVENLQTIKQQLKVYRQAVLKDAFEGKYSKTDPVIWEKPIIKSICDLIVDCPHSTPKWVAQGYLCLRTTNFKRGYLDLSEKSFVSESTFLERITRTKPQENDVLYSREGAILGVACIVPKNIELCLGQRMMLMRTKQRYSSEYLMHYLNSPVITHYVAKNTGGTASPHINVQDIKNYVIPVPSFEEQLSIVSAIEDRLSVCDHIEQTVNETLLKAEILRQSILKKAFEGKLV